MKIDTMKKTFSPIILPLVVSLALFVSCTKSGDGNNVKDYNDVILSYPANTSYNASLSGVDFADKALLELKTSVPSDTITFQAAIQNPLGKDINVQIAENVDALNTYNAGSSVKYDAFPTNSYSIVTPTATIAAGSTNVLLKMAIQTGNFDISKTGYMLPITLQATGQGVVTAFNTIYFHIDKDPYPPYDRTGWKVTGFSDEELPPSDNGYATNVLDGDPSTFWHSIWDLSNHPGISAVPGFPHWISFDMGTAHELHGIYFLERQNGSSDKAKNVTISTSADGVTWTDAANITLQNSTVWQKMAFESPTASVRYFKTTFTSNYSGALWTNMAEIRPF